MEKKIRGNDYRYLLLAVIAAVILVVTACGKSETPAATTPQAPAVNQPPQTPQAPAANDSAAAQANAEWEQLVEAATKEGKIILSGAPGEVWRQALVEPFTKKYPGIQIEYTGLNGRDFWPRVKQERAVNQFLWDLRIGGSNDAYNEKDDSIQAVRPILMIPDIMEDANWLGGFDGMFVDTEKQSIPSFLAYSGNPVTVNRDFMPESELNSPEQLLDPKFKGQIVLNDPRGGAGTGYLTVLHAAYGEQFITDLLTKQELVVTSDSRQMAEWIIRGRYPIAIGFDSSYLISFHQEGLGLNVKDLDEGPLGMSIGFGSIQFLRDAPNPNAAKLYINWLLSKEGQEAITQIVKLNSRRLDVAPVDEKTVIDVAAYNAGQYVSHQEEEHVALRRKTQEMALQLIK